MAEKKNKPNSKRKYPNHFPGGDAPPAQQRCTHKCRATGERCRQWAMKGWKVCTKHGAGTKKRQGGAGTPEKPGGRPPISGLYSKRVRSSLLDQVKAYLSDPATLSAESKAAFLQALTDRATSLMEAREEAIRLLESDKDNPASLTLAMKLELGLADYQAHVANVAEKASVAQDRWYKQVHGEKHTVITPDMVKRIFEVAERVLIGKYIPAENRAAASAEFDAELDKIPAPPLPQ